MQISKALIAKKLDFLNEHIKKDLEDLRQFGV